MKFGERSAHNCSIRDRDLAEQLQFDVKKQNGGGCSNLAEVDLLPFVCSFNGCCSLIESRSIDRIGSERALFLLILIQREVFLSSFLKFKYQLLLVLLSRLIFGELMHQIDRDMILARDTRYKSL